MWRRGPQVYPQVPQVGPVARRRAWGHGRLVRVKVRVRVRGKVRIRVRVRCRVRVRVRVRKG